MKEEIEISVDKAKFIEVGRIFSRVYKPSGSSNVVFTLGEGKLLIEFHGGGCEFECKAKANFVAEMKAKAFASIIAVYRSKKENTGSIVLTFRPAFGEFATPLAGGKAKFFQCVKSNEFRVP